MNGSDLDGVVVESLPHDGHAYALRWALEKAGCPVHFIFGDNFPTKSEITVGISATGGAAVSYEGVENRFSISQETRFTYWARRLCGPQLAGAVAQVDENVAKNENKAALSGMRGLLADFPYGTFVNPLDAKSMADHKPKQLVCASSVGMRVPRTIFSNSKREIINFIDSEGGRVIFKTNTPMLWKRKTPSGHVRAMTYSSFVNRETIERHALVSACSGIYQQPIPKQYEVRVTVFGSACFASKLFSQSSADTAVDWRQGQRTMRNEPIEAPASIELQCTQFLSNMGLVMGCFDFVVTPDDEWIFLECNEQGQWLWQEQNCPEIRLVDAFSQFVVNPHTEFKYKSDGGLRLQSYMRERWRDDMEFARTRNVMKSGYLFRPEETAA